MNFFAAQDKARRNTLWMILLFILAVAGLIFLTNLLLLVVLAYLKTGYFVFSLSELKYFFDLPVFVAVTVGVSLLIFGGSFYKTLSLSKAAQPLLKCSVAG